MPGPPPLRIFLSYRRDDASGHAGRLYDALASRYGDRNVFMDVDAIPLGSDFGGAIDRAVEACDVVIVLIGRGWLQATDANGRRRLDDGADYVRREVESALAHDVLVVPTCVQGAPVPRAEQLPESLAPLTGRQGIELDDSGWQDDVGRLIRRLEAGRTEDRPRRRVAILLTALVLLALAGGALALALSTGEDPNRPAAGAGSGDEDPTTAEARLLASVPEATRAGCQPASETEPTATASVACDVGGALTTVYHQFPDDALADAWYRQVRAAWDVPADGGDCTPEDFPGEGSYGDSGRYFCVLSADEELPEVYGLDRRSSVGLRTTAWSGKRNPAEKVLDLWECCIKPVEG